jgi:hypothetical protein
MAYVKLPILERYFVCISADNSDILVLKRSIDRPGDIGMCTGFEFSSSNFLIMLLILLGLLPIGTFGVARAVATHLGSSTRAYSLM